MIYHFVLSITTLGSVGPLESMISCMAEAQLAEPMEAPLVQNALAFIESFAAGDAP